ncbi:uncharacterized protein METZ01_LOCUS476747, partial [marine metagenome]
VPNFSKRHNLSETWLSELEAPVQDPDIFFDEEGQESALTLLAHVLREILHWICEGNRNRGGYALTVARKVIAMAWVLRPEIFDGLSLTAICKSKGVEMNPKAFCSVSLHVDTISGRAVGFASEDLDLNPVCGGAESGNPIHGGCSMEVRERAEEV